MGCAQSKIENEEAVARCKERKQYMKEAVSSRNAFAAAHSSYAVSLKETGAALSEYGQAEMGPHLPSPSTASGGPTASAVTQPPIEHLPPPPPPLPDYSPLQRSVSMPEVISEPLRRKKNPNKEPSTADASIREEEENDDLGESGIKGEASDASSSIPAPPRREQVTPPPPPPGGSSSTWDFWGMDPFYTSHTLGDTGEIHPEQETRTQETRYSKTSASVPATVIVPNPDLGGGVSDDIPPVTPEREVLDTPPPPPKPPKKMKQGGSIHHQHAVSAGASDAKKGKMVPSTVPAVNLVQMLTDLDDHFLKASESAQEVSKMLEATRLHYHSNFADNRGHIDHSARVMRVITWNRSFKGLPNDDGNDVFDNEESETHATILDKLLAWEKKLYDEVKAGELMKIEYQRKVALLNKQKKRGTNQETLEKTKAAVSHLHTRYIVDMQSMDSTVSEIQRLRDDQLYPKLAALIHEMAKMWEVMHHHHDNQLKIVMDLRALDISSTPKETTQNHYQRTEQLHHAASKWHTQFQKLVSHQKEYIQALNSWLKLNLIPIESSLKEKVSSPPRIPDPPIKALLHAWHDQLEKLPDELAKSAISSFAAVIYAIMLQQQEELKQRDKCEEIRKELARKERAFNDWFQKYQSRRASTDDNADQERSESANQKDLVAERKLVVETLQKKLEEEEENHKRLCKQVREKAVGSLKTHLPELFRAVSDFSDACSTMYKNLRPATQMQRQAETSS